MSLHILGIAGSLRRGSYNRALLRAAAGLLPADTVIQTAEIGGLPLYDADLEAMGVPAAVVELKARVRAADALLIATPEYNTSVPGVLKNALDWLSRPPDQVLDGKPAAIMGASPGMFGTARSQQHLRQIATTLNLLVLAKPDVFVPRAAEKFSAEGELTDERSREAVRKLVFALRDWTLRLRVAEGGPGTPPVSV